MDAKEPSSGDWRGSLIANSAFLMSLTINRDTYGEGDWSEWLAEYNWARLPWTGTFD